MTQEDVVLLLKRTIKDAVERIETQSEHAYKLDEPGIAEALGQVASALSEVDVDFHVCMLDVYRAEEAEVEAA